MSLLPLIASGGKRLVTQYFTSGSWSWVCPVTTFRIENMIGKSQDGTPQVGTSMNTGGGFTGLYQTSGVGANSGYGTWDQLKAYADATFNAINAGGATQYTNCTVSCYPNPSPTNTVSVGGVNSLGGTTIAGSAFYSYQGGANASGLIGSNGNIVINYQVGTGGSNGSPFSAFGQSFPGGAMAGAPVTSYTNVTVTPGTTYSGTIPSGGYLQISYLQ